MTRPLVYVAGPYHGDGSRAVMLNARDAYKHGEELDDLGYETFIPHGLFAEQLTNGTPERVIIRKCLAHVERADYVWRIPGTSNGAELECEHAMSKGVPVLYAACATTFHRQVLDARREL